MVILLQDILRAFYPSFRFAILLTVFFLFTYKEYSEPGTRDEEHLGIKWAFLDFIEWMRKDRKFRKLFFLVLYISLVLFQTLYSRDFQISPFSDVVGSWTLNAETIENTILLFPYTFMLYECFPEHLARKGKLMEIIKNSLIVSFCTSFLLEFLQILLVAGTWQLSDLTFNTLGGICGGIACWVCRRVRRKKDE